MLFRSLLVLSLVALSSVSHAQDRATARALFDEARELMRAGDYAQACPKLEASRDIVAGVGILFNLAECYEGLGRTASAWNLYRDVAAQLAGDPARKQAAEQRAKALEPKLSTLRLDVTDTAGLVVRRDGRTVPASHYRQALPIDPGTYAIEASAPGHTSLRRDVAVKADGDHASVTIALLAEKPPKEKPRRRFPPATLPPELQPRDDAPTARIVGWAFTFGGAAFTAIGFALYGAGSNQLAESEERCGPDRNACADAEAADLGRDGLTLQRIGLPMGIAGAAALVGGIATLIIYREDKSEVNVAITPSGAALHTRW